jgi:hypothetical protein
MHYVIISGSSYQFLGASIAAWILAGASLLSALVSVFAAVISFKSLRSGIDMFRREGIFDLHSVWSDLNEINLDNKDDVVTTHVVDAVNALSLTSALWNHDIMSKTIIYQTCWDEFKVFYDKINSSDMALPGLGRRASDLIEDEMVTAYNEMNEYGAQQVEQTNLDLWNLMKS